MFYYLTVNNLFSVYPKPIIYMVGFSYLRTFKIKMTGQLYINDKDAWITWGVRLRRGSYDALNLGAPQKEYVKNSLSSQNGSQYFTDNSKIDERQVSILFYIEGSTNRQFYDRKKAFEDELRKGLLLFRVPGQFTVYKLILSDFTEFSSYDSYKKGFITARFNEPNPQDRIQL